MASPANSVHFHDTVNNNRLPPLQQNVDPRWGEPLPQPYLNSSPVYNQRMAFHPVFLMSKPRMRGLTQIGVAHFQLALGIVLNFFRGHIYTWFTYIIFWGPPFLICSGFLAVAAHNIVSSKMIRACNVFQTISILISISGLVLSCMDAYSIYSCSRKCGNLETMTVLPLVIFANVMQIQLSGYIVYYGFLSLNYMLEHSPQAPANVNLGYVPSAPPAYSQATNYGQPPFQQPAPSIPPPPYPSAPTSSSDVSNEWKDYLQPPPYSE